MSGLLYVLLGVLLGVIVLPIVLLIVFKLFVRFFLKRLAAALGGVGSGIPPFRIELEPVDEPNWEDAKLIEKLTAALEANGFQQAGDYILAPSPGIEARTFASPSESLYGIIYDWPKEQMGTLIDIVATEFHSEDQSEGAHFMVSSAPETGLDEAPWVVSEKMEVDLNESDQTIEAMVSRLREMVAGKSLMPANPENFARLFKAAYARKMDWMVDRGGLQREEIIRNLVTMHGKNEDDDDIEEVVDLTEKQWKMAVSDFMSEKIQERFLRHVTKMSAAEWEDVRDRLYIVHEQMLPERVHVMLAEHMVDEAILEEDDDDAYERVRGEYYEKLSPAFQSDNPRTAFDTAQELLPPNRRYKRLAKIKGRWPADVYLEPEEVD